MGKTAPLPSQNGAHTNGHTENGDAHPQPTNGHAPGSQTTFTDNSSKCGCCTSCLEKVSHTIIGGLESAFGRLGLSIGRHPWRYIIGCFVAAAFCGFGLVFFNEVTDPDKLWVPDGAQVLDAKRWIDDNYPSTVRREEFIGVADNIMTPAGLAALLDIYQNSLTISAGGTTLSDVCYKAGTTCIVYSILEIWSYNQATILALTQDQIINDVNAATTSPVYGGSIDLNVYLGGQTTNSSGSVVAAQAATITWLTNGNDSMESTTEAWESKLIDLCLAGHADLTGAYVFTARSWEDESGDAIQDDILKLSIGYFLVILFVFAVLGKFNFLEQRAWLSLAGFLCVGLSILVSMGLSSAFQLDYGPVHSVLPFLLLGVGVDDMFVIMGALNNLKPEERELDIPNRISTVLRHAGVSITVTSFTDFMAFMIGATTIIPALRSFCVFAGMGILGLYLLQSMFFTACVTLDLRRLDAKRDACCCCYKRPSPPYTPNKCSQNELIPMIFRNFLAKALSKLPVQIAVVVAALALFGVNLWGFIELEQYFDPIWFLPSDSYPYLHDKASDKYFPNDGFSGYVYCGNLNYWSHQTEFEALETAMTNSPWINNGTTDSWFLALTTWLASSVDPTVTAKLDANKYPTTEVNFISLTYQMSTSVYSRTSSYLQFSSASDDITASRFPFRHINMDNSGDQIDAMDNTRALVENAGFSTSECFPYGQAYLTWETNKVIQEELYRNLALALVCVFLVTLILIANLRTSCFVFVGVLCTLVDVAGTMHFWDLTIDTVTSIILILAIGLAVDYSAHIGHTFMTIRGDKTVRMMETVSEIGPPVFYGGFSTFLAFILLSDSTSYVFGTFFKVNFLVVVYGLFHGLLVVPILLCWMGPDPYQTAGQSLTSDDTPKKHKDDVEGVTNTAFVGNDDKMPGTNGHELGPREMSTVSHKSVSTPDNITLEKLGQEGSEGQTNSVPPV